LTGLVIAIQPKTITIKGIRNNISQGRQNENDSLPKAHRIEAAPSHERRHCGDEASPIGIGQAVGEAGTLRK
jgi:hypothetical protein